MKFLIILPFSTIYKIIKNETIIIEKDCIFIHCANYDSRQRMHKKYFPACVPCIDIVSGCEENYINVTDLRLAKHILYDTSLKKYEQTESPFSIKSLSHQQAIDLYYS